MALEVVFRGGPRAGEKLTFDDRVEQINFGRDSQMCQVVFPADATRVGREHFALRRQVGRYRLVLNGTNAVLVNGQRAIDGQELPDRADIELGQGGPQLVVLTVGNSVLPPTIGKVHEAGPATRLARAERSAAIGKWVAAITALVLLVVVRQGYKAWKSIPPDVAEQLRATLKEAAPSVYLVIKRSNDGSTETVATAWVIDRERGILATNGHVAEDLRSLRGDQKLFVRSCEDTPRDFEISDVRIHPGYEEFQRLWREYGPAIRTSPVAYEQVDSPGPGCDVALMFVVDKEGLAPALPLAPQSVLDTMGALYPIGYAGYPMEGLSLGGVNVNAPVPATHVAYVVDCTTYFNLKAAPDADRLLVQHALPATGGASGSPIINADGQVVAILSGVNFIGKTDAGRIGTPANISFGQRIDLARELLDGTAETNQVSRLATWNAEISKHYGRLERLKKMAEMAKATESELEDWTDELNDNERKQVTVGKPQTFELTIPAAAPPVERGVLKHNVRLTKSDRIMIVAASNSEIGLRVRWKDETGETKELNGTSASKNCRSVWMGLREDADCEISLTGVEKQIVVLTCYQAKVELITPTERIERQANDWIQRLRQFVAPSARLTRLADEHGALQVMLVDGKNAFAKSVSLGRLQPGDYLVVVASNANEDIDLVTTRDDARDTDLASDRSIRSWASNTFTLSEACPVSATVIGESEETSFDLRVYRADRSANGAAARPAATP